MLVMLKDMVEEHQSCLMHHSTLNMMPTPTVHQYRDIIIALYTSLCLLPESNGPRASVPLISLFREHIRPLVIESPNSITVIVTLLNDLYISYQYQY